jgi:hypothetical protein
VETLLVAQCKGLSEVPDENKLAAAKRVLKLSAQHKDMQFVLHGEAVQVGDADAGTVVDALQTAACRCAAIFPHENAKEFCRVTTGLGKAFVLVRETGQHPALWQHALSLANKVQQLDQLSAAFKEFSDLGHTVQKRLAADKGLSKIREVIRIRKLVVFPLDKALLDRFPSPGAISDIGNSTKTSIEEHGKTYIQGTLPALFKVRDALAPTAGGSSDTQSWKAHLPADCNKDEFMDAAKVSILCWDKDAVQPLIRDLQTEPR